jgi:hypothetical protein
LMFTITFSFLSPMIFRAAFISLFRDARYIDFALIYFQLSITAPLAFAMNSFRISLTFLRLFSRH